jgi:thioredoxin-related protein
MSKILAFILLFSYSLFAIEYTNDFDATLKSAKKDNKKVFLLYTQTGCPACEYMIDEVFENEDVETYLDTYYKVAVVDIYKDGMIKGYRAFGTPTMYFLDSDGKPLIRKIIGGMEPQEFLKKLKSIK